MTVCQQNVRGIHIKFFIQFLVCHEALQILRQCTGQIIINFRIFLSVNSRKQKYCKDQQKNRETFCHKAGQFSNIRKDCFVSRFFQWFIKNQNHGRQDRNTSDHTEYNTFCHNDSQIHTQFETHETQSNKSGHRRNRTSHNRGNGLGNGMCHGIFMILRKYFLLILITVPQKNRIIHGHTELQHRTQRLGHIGYLSHKHICSQVIYDCHTDTQQEKDRNQERIHGQ